MIVDRFKGLLWCTLTVAGALAVSCIDEKEPDNGGDDPTPVKRYIIATATDFEQSSKASVTSDGAFSWAEGDEIGVVRMDDKTSAEKYTLKTVSSDPKTASFESEANLIGGKTYASFSPYENVTYASNGTATASFLGQNQKENGSKSHLGAYEFMYSSATVPVEGRIDFNFAHKVSLLKIVLPVKESGEYTELVLKASSDIFATSASMSLADGVMSPVSKSSEFKITLDKISVNQGSEIVVWASILPVAVPSDGSLVATLASSTGSKSSFTIKVSTTSFEAGKIYSLKGESASRILFNDDFSWVSQFITSTCADFVNGEYSDISARISYGNSNSVNLRSTYPDTFPAALADAGYEDKVPDNKTIYGQGTKENPYLKFCKGNTQTALVLQPFAESCASANLSFDWAVHMTTTALDEVDIQVRIEGDGYFANGTKISDSFVLSQSGVDTPVWSKAYAELRNVNASTKLLISSAQAFNNNYLASGQHRFYLDNILISADPIPGGDTITPTPGSTVYGVIRCGDKPVSGVVVSDGYEVVRTNSSGVYQMKSAKKTGYVFMSIPSGYEAFSDGVLPLFHKKLVKSASVAERVDFELVNAGDQTNHTILFCGDMHMANRTNDKNQFRKFTTEIAAYVKDHPSEKIYAITLGDMTWDLYWYSKNYCFEQYLAEYRGVVNGLQIFHTIGNHDHDMNATGDWDTVLRFRNAVCPNYYSFNIGKIHYVSIDDIECTNSPASTTDGSGRSYNEKVATDVLNWLKKDLAYVDQTTPVVITMHAPVYTKDGGDGLKNVSALTSLLSGYNVTFVSGHTHVCYTVDKSSSIREHNSGAVCAAWWWAGKYNPTYNIGTDGAPSGYRIASVKGTKMTSYYKATGMDASYQFRAYDRNKINYDVNMVPSGAQNNFLTELALSLIYGNYSGGSSSNDVIINVWDWNKNWKVEVTENGKPLTVTQKTLMDPSFYIAYTIPHMNAGNNSVSWHPSPTNHMFVVRASSATSTLTIKVTDDEGRVYTREMKRPLENLISNYSN